MKTDYTEFTEYVLMNKNTPVLAFLYDEEAHAIFKITEIINEKYAPLGIVEYKTGISRAALNNWWKSRAIPASRENLKHILEELKIDTTLTLLEKCSGLSLSDQYWIKKNDSKVQWEDVNFFENPFSEDVGKLLFGRTTDSQNLNLVSPDCSSDGDLIKKWKIINNKRCLIKGGNSLNNQEPYNEVIASKLYERLLAEDEYVPYFLVEDEGKTYSCCETMISTSEELVSAMNIDSTMKLRGNQSLYEHYILCCKNLGIPDTEDKINKMLTCDYILANYDRHYRNFGAIRNVETLEWERTAPIFDSGSSLWARTPTIEIPSFKYKGKPFKTNPKEQLALVTDLSWFDIKKVSDFDMVVRNILSQNPLMDKNRINIISNKVKERIIEVKERKNILEKNYSLETHSINDSFENNDYEIEM
jgi:hypothetical protein